MEKKRKPWSEESKERARQAALNRNDNNHPKGENHPNWKKDKNHYCIDCGKKLSRTAKHRCWNCYVEYSKGENHSCYKGGSTIVKCNCDNCNKELKRVVTEYNRNERHFCDKKCQGKFNRRNYSAENSWNWQGGKIEFNERLRNSNLYKDWRKEVFLRDNFTCQKCGAKSSKNNPVYIEAHHLKQFALIMLENNIKTINEAMNCKELWNIANGETLCLKCHNKIKHLTSNLRKVI